MGAEQEPSLDPSAHRGETPEIETSQPWEPQEEFCWFNIPWGVGNEGLG